MTKEIKNHLEISRIELQKVADFLPYPFIIAEVIDGIHHNTFLNENFLEEIGYTLEEIPTIEAWYEKAYPEPNYRNQVITNWNQEELECRQRGKVSVKMKSQVTCKNGSTRWYEVKASVINPVHVVAFVDLDKEIVLQEKLKSINQNNDRMLSILGHDLRSPVANLMAISAMAASTDISKTEFASLNQLINEQSVQVLELLDNTLNWARLNFNSIQPVIKKTDMKALIAAILPIYKSAYESKKITVNLNTEGLGQIETDSEIMTIIVRNLLSNAIKFTARNGSISITLFDNQLTVTDSGVGMSPAMIAAILANKYSSRSGTDNEQGIGIGLQLVINLAAKINCQLAIESQEQVGTTMRLTF